MIDTLFSCRQNSYIDFQSPFDILASLSQRLMCKLVVYQWLCQSICLPICPLTFSNIFFSNTIGSIELRFQFFHHHMGQHDILVPAKDQKSLHICVVLPEFLLLAYTKHSNRWLVPKFDQKSHCVAEYVCLNREFTYNVNQIHLAGIFIWRY